MFTRPCPVTSGASPALALAFQEPLPLTHALWEAHCTSHVDESKLREMIEAGGKQLFEKTVRGLAPLVNAAYRAPGQSEGHHSLDLCTLSDWR